MKKFLLVFIFLKLNKNQCSEGCLRCNVNDFCEICDIKNFYLLKQNNCQQIEIQNCNEIDSTGKCINCYNGYYFNEQSQGCEKVQKKNRVKNCYKYDSDQSCKKCIQDHYIKLHTCLPIIDSIPGCLEYQDKNQCKKCKTGFQLNAYKCEYQEAQQYCKFYAEVQCKECKSGFYLDYQQTQKNLLKIENEMDIKNLTSFINSEFYSEKIIYTDSIKVCQKKYLEYCQEYETPTKCRLCKENFYLDQFQNCVPKTNQLIPNCKKYNQKIQCVECMKDFYLKDNKTCLKNTSINNCLVYNTKANEPTCLQCKQKFKVIKNQCVEMEEIKNCKLYDNQLCKTCMDKFVRSNDHLSCQPQIENCKNYKLFLKDDEKIYCVECKDYYFLKLNTCNKGNIEHCQIYDDEFTCQECNDQHYLNDSKCVLRKKIEKCEKYQPENNECKTCVENYYSFFVVNYCKKINEIKYCEDYKNESECKKCQKGYYLNSDAICVKIKEDGCLEKNDGNCIACNKNYFIFNIAGKDDKQNNIFNQICLETPEFIEETCDDYSIKDKENDDTIDEVDCFNCKENNFPIQSFDNNSNCYQNEYAETFFQGLKFDEKCQRYDQQGKCIQCYENKYLDKNNKCLDNCKFVHVPVNFYDSNQDEQSLTPQQINLCHEYTSKKGCAVLGPDSDGINNICIACKNTYQTIIHRKIKYSHELKYSSMNPIERKIISPNDIYSEVKCVNADQNTDLEFNSKIKNCELYFELLINDNKTIGCVKCKHQYVGLSDNYGFISTCKKYDDECDENELQGLEVQWKNLLSCHQCKKKTQIPVLAMKCNTSKIPIPQKYTRYSLNEPWVMDTDPDMPVINCLEPNADTFGYDDEKLFALPENCGAAFLNLRKFEENSLNSVKQIDTEQIDNLASFCIACKPGYKPLKMSEKYPEIKVQCNLIDNCKGKQWFNSCSQCEENYVYEWKNSSITYDVCIENKVSNCFAGVKEGDNQICKACKKGFSLYKGLCIEFKTPFCEENVVIQSYDLNDVNYAFYHSQEGLFCKKCKQDYISIERDYNMNFLCYNTDQKYFSMINDKYYKFCSSYALSDSDDFYCVKCQKNYYLILSDKTNKKSGKCVRSLDNCLEQQTEGKCLKCREGYSLVNDKCIVGDILRCKIFNQSKPSDKIICTQCLPGYYIFEENTCKQGKVKNCEILFDEQNCMKCLDGFIKISRGGPDYCYEIPKNLNCKKATFEKLDDKLQIDCINCNDHTIKQYYPQSQNDCYFFDEIEHCIEYNESDDLMTEDFICEKCTPKYYLNEDQTQCLKRINSYENCEELDTDEDTCMVCKENYVLLADKCVYYNKDLIGCLEYDKEDSCKKCDDNYYLDQGRCLKLNPKKSIENCVSYDSDQNCLECKINFLYIKETKKCVAVKASNCLTYKDINNCQYCPDGYGLVKNKQSNYDCKKLFVRACQSYENSIDFPCRICDKNFYPDEKKMCQSVEKLIDHCIQYQTKDLCQRCEEEFILSIDGKKCLLKNEVILKSQIDENCSYKILKQNCVICQSGAYFKNGECVLCPQSEGCFMCNHQQPWKCEICQSGFSMNKLGKCLKNKKQKTQTSNSILYIFNILILLNVF